MIDPMLVDGYETCADTCALCVVVDDLMGGGVRPYFAVAVWRGTPLCREHLVVVATSKRATVAGKTITF